MSIIISRGCFDTDNKGETQGDREVENSSAPTPDKQQFLAERKLSEQEWSSLHTWYWQTSLQKERFSLEHIFMPCIIKMDQADNSDGVEGDADRPVNAIFKLPVWTSSCIQDRGTKQPS